MILEVFFIILNGFLHETWASFINIEPFFDPAIIKQNQVYFNRKERFLKFDTKDNELEIELGISIPFIKVPMATHRNALGEEKESEITINGPGILVAGTLMLTSFIVVPLLFTTAPQADRRRSFRQSGIGHFWENLQNLDEALYKNGIDSSSCLQKSLCWIADKSEKAGTGSWLHNFFESWWFKRLMGVSGDIRRTNSKTCNLRYSGCSLTSQHIQNFIERIKRDHVAHLTRGWNTTTQ